MLNLNIFFKVGVEEGTYLPLLWPRDKSQNIFRHPCKISAAIEIYLIVQNRSCTVVLIQYQGDPSINQSKMKRTNLYTKKVAGNSNFIFWNKYRGT